MPIRVFTLPFDPRSGQFDDGPLNRFLLSKQVNRLQAEFFTATDSAYWTVFLDYEPVLKADPEANLLDEPQRLLLERLRQWRKETAEAEGVPVFIVATNRQLMDVVQAAPATAEALHAIHGFGKKKLERYGDAIVGLIRAFYEKAPPQYGKKAARRRPKGPKGAG